MYLDANATTPLDPRVLQEMLPWLQESFHNPSSAYRAAKRVREAIEHSRVDVARLLGAEPCDVFFTSGGTESINTAVRSLDATMPAGRVLTAALEHSAVLRSLAATAREVCSIAATPDGVVKTDAWQHELATASFSGLMAANNETGVVQPWRWAAEQAEQRGVPFFCDAVQAAGKMPIHVAASPVDFMAISAHKFHGPKGIGALYVRRGRRFSPLLHGGGQESGWRSGTEAVANIVGMGVAARLAWEHLQDQTWTRVQQWRDRLEAELRQLIDGVNVNGGAAERLPNTSHVSLHGCEAAGLVILLDEWGLECSAGSACMAGKQQPSHVQLAMGFDRQRAASSLRLSFSRLNQPDDAILAATTIAKAVQKWRSVQSPLTGPVTVYRRQKSD